MAVILSGWKEIARYLGCGIRTAQRWEDDGLPVRRPGSGSRSHVVVNSDDIDLWIADSVVRRSGRLDIVANIQRARELQAEVQRARHELRSKVAALKQELAILRTKRRKPA